MHTDFSILLWIPPVEKSVDNVEKLRFSTVIFLFFTGAALSALLHIRLYIRYELQVAFVLCRHLHTWLFFCNSIEKVGIFPERHLS